MLGEQLREHVLPVDVHRAHPGQVIEADLIDHDGRGLDPEQPRERALEADRDVAEADRTVAGIEQRARDDPDRVREVDDPRAGGRELARPLGDPEHDRHRAESLGQAARARRLLADAAARERDRLVAEARLLPADADLDEHEVGPVERTVELVRHFQPPA